MVLLMNYPFILEEEDAFNATRDAFNAASESDSEVGDEAPGGSRCSLQ